MTNLDNDLHDICETLSTELSKINTKLKTSNGALNAGDIDYIDKLTHALKSVETVKAMREKQSAGGYYDDYMSHSQQSRSNPGYGMDQQYIMHSNPNYMNRYPNNGWDENQYRYEDGMTRNNMPIGRPGR